MKFYIPNVSKFLIGRKLLDPFLYKFGLVKASERERIYEKGNNNKINRYLRYQDKRIRKMASENDPRFWELIEVLRKSSKAYRLLALMNVRPLWYKDMNWKSLVRCLRRLNGICYRQRDCFRITRTAIPKPDGTKRFINNPGVSWRMYLWMLNHFVGVWINRRINESQHGHRPGKGSVTCWKEILDSIDHYEYIYEFDFKKFHDRISRRILVKALRSMDLPDKWLKRLVNLQSPYVLERDSEDEAVDRQFKDYAINHFAQGVVQGSNLAAFIGLAVLEELKVYDVPNGKYIGYADDGLLLLNDPKEVERWKERLNTRESGVELKESKSGFVKFEGKWIKDLEFVGARYVGEERSLYANTHSGKTWKYEWEEKEDFLSDLKENPGLFKSDKSAKPWISAPKTLNADNGRKFLGFLMSKIWSDSPYESFEQLADRSLRIKKGSFADIFCENRKTLSLYNISSECYRRLMTAMKEERVTLRPRNRSRGKPQAPRPELGMITKALTGFHLLRDPSKYLVGTATTKPHPMYLTMDEFYRAQASGMRGVLEYVEFQMEDDPDKEVDIREYSPEYQYFCDLKECSFPSN